MSSFYFIWMKLFMKKLEKIVPYTSPDMPNRITLSIPSLLLVHFDFWSVKLDYILTEIYMYHIIGKINKNYIIWKYIYLVYLVPLMEFQPGGPGTCIAVRRLIVQDTRFFQILSNAYIYILSLIIWRDAPSYI